MKGKVVKVILGAVNAEVAFELPGGGQLVSIITNQSAKNPGLEEGKEAYAVIKASSVMMAVDQFNRRIHTMKRTFSVLIMLTFFLAACGPAAPTASAPENRNLILATTTSTQDSGLLDVLVPMFEQETGYTVQTIAVGTGAALKMGEEGNADVLLAHAPSAEKVLVEAGVVTDRFLVMHNDFVIVGPASDPAAIKGLSVVDAYKTIAAKEASFVTRGDNSGTHKAELNLWKNADLDADTFSPDFYISSGQGMGPTLTIASEREAYTFTDRGTYLALMANLDLDILVEGDTVLLNVYHVMTVNPELWPKVNYDGALAFAQFMVRDDVQKIIAEFGVDKFGMPLFFPDAGRNPAELGLD